MSEKVQWPATPVAPSGDDLAAPIKSLLVELGLLAAVTPSGSDAVTYPALQVIQAGSLAFSRQWAKIIAGVSGIAAGGGLLSLFKEQDPALRLVIIGGIAVVLATAVLAIALVIAADVRCRATASAARTASLATVAAAFIRSSASLQRPGGTAPSNGKAEDWRYQVSFR
jgi:hypothetical protein